MISGGGSIHRRHPAAAGLLLLAAALAIAEAPEPQVSASVSLPPGVYPTPQLVGLSAPAGYRAALSLNGSAVDTSSLPLYLDSPRGESRVYNLSVTLLNLDPGAEGTAESSGITRDYRWTIDRKPPSRPVFSSVSSEAGALVSCSIDESGVIQWIMWHPDYRASSSGKGPSGLELFVPTGARLCAWGIDDAGNRGPAAVNEASPAPGTPPFRVVNPVPGEWANPQSLVIQAAEGLTVKYTTDGTDPASGGQPYLKPEVLEATGVVLLRLSVSDSEGNAWSSKVLYTVTPSDPPPLDGFDPSEAVKEAGDFAEYFIPEGCTWGIGEGLTALPGGKSVLFTGVRGVQSLYPLSVTRDAATWRYVISSGSVEGPSESLAEGPAGVAPEVSVLDWYFVAIHWDSAVYASLDGAPWTPVEGPLLVDRSVPHTLRWYSPSWQNSRIQTLALPEKPRLEGLPDTGVSAEPVFISSSDPAWTLHYRSLSVPGAPAALRSDPVLASGLLLETPAGASERFSLSFLAEYGGVVHGRLGADVVIDRKPPRTPSLSLSPDLSWSRLPVVLSVSGEDSLEVSVLPEAEGEGPSRWNLSGDAEGPVTYTVRAEAVDRAGNRSEAAVRTVTVDRNAIYVDPSWAGIRSGAPDGSPEAPYSSLDLALETIRDNGNWRIYLGGDAKLGKEHTMLANLRIIGDGHTLEFLPGSSITVSGGSLSLESCGLVSTAPQPAGSLLTVTNGSFKGIRLKASLTGSDKGRFLRAVNSAVSLEESSIELAFGTYGVVLDLQGGEVSLISSLLSLSARNAAVLSLVRTRATLENTSVEVRSTQAGRALEAWGSTVVLDGSRFIRHGGGTESRDTALWTDAATALKTLRACSFTGFRAERETGKR